MQSSDGPGSRVMCHDCSLYLIFCLVKSKRFDIEVALWNKFIPVRNDRVAEDVI